MLWNVVLYLILAFYAYRLIRLFIKSLSPSKTLMIVFGSGGHTSEMKRMIQKLDFNKFTKILCVAAKTDTLSLPTVSDDFAKQGKNTKLVEWKLIPRSREVKQSYITSFFTTIYALVYCFFLIIWNEPTLIVTNGPGTALPLCYSLKLSRILLYNLKGKILFIESFCRVDNLSVTGRLVYPISDRFIVQWEELTKRYKRAEYLGTLI